jgi:hypothetical protein
VTPGTFSAATRAAAGAVVEGSMTTTGEVMISDASMSTLHGEARSASAAAV